jgi:hypothetical protein
MAKLKKGEDQLRAAYQTRQNQSIGGGVLTEASSIEAEAKKGLDEQTDPKSKGFLGAGKGGKGKGQISDVKKQLSTRASGEYGADRAEESKTFQSDKIAEGKKGVKNFSAGATSQRFPKGVPPGADKMQPPWDFNPKDQSYLTGQAKESRRQELWSNYRNAQVKLKKGAKGSPMMVALGKKRKHAGQAHNYGTSDT